jgi:inosine-uridine nucleoside N-ribohydrolase
MDPCVAENTVVVWLGGHSLEYGDCAEFNLFQDVAAARVVMGCGVPFVQLPCMGVVSNFTISKPELDYWFRGKSELGTYLAENTCRAAESYAKGRPWTRVIWDVTAVAWLLNDEDRFMKSRLIPTALPSYANRYEIDPNRDLMRYVYYIRRDSLWKDVIEKITETKLP